MKPLRECGGKWIGFWIQGPVKGHMEFELFVRGFRVHGRGKDSEGHFEIEGIYDPQSHELNLEKRYGQQSWNYCGRWDGSRISGDWRAPDPIDGSSGAFMIWPDH